MTMITATSRENVAGSPAARAADLAKTYGKAGTAVTRQPAAPRWQFDCTTTTTDVGPFPRRARARAVQRTLATALLGNFPAGGTP
jgi:hypothetical protein